MKKGDPQPKKEKGKKDEETKPAAAEKPEPVDDEIVLFTSDDANKSGEFKETADDEEVVDFD